MAQHRRSASTDDSAGQLVACFGGDLLTVGALLRLDGPRVVNGAHRPGPGVRKLEPVGTQTAQGSGQLALHDDVGQRDPAIRRSGRRTRNDLVMTRRLSPDRLMTPCRCLREALASLDPATLGRLEQDLAVLIKALDADERGATIPLSQM